MRSEASNCSAALDWKEWLPQVLSLRGCHGCSRESGQETEHAVLWKCQTLPVSVALKLNATLTVEEQTYNNNNNNTAMLLFLLHEFFPCFCWELDDFAFRHFRLSFADLILPSWINPLMARRSPCCRLLSLPNYRLLLCSRCSEEWTSDIVERKVSNVATKYALQLGSLYNMFLHVLHMTAF